MLDSKKIIFDDIKLNQQAQFTVELTDNLVNRFSELTGDVNPLHMEEEYASGTIFKGRIAHGMLAASFFSRLVGMYLPGRYGLYLSQKLNFRKPCRIGMHVLVCGIVTQKVDSARVITIKTEINDAKTGECLIDGEAVVSVLA